MMNGNNISKDIQVKKVQYRRKRNKMKSENIEQFKKRVNVWFYKIDKQEVFSSALKEDLEQSFSCSINVELLHV